MCHHTAQSVRNNKYILGITDDFKDILIVTLWWFMDQMTRYILQIIREIDVNNEIPILKYGIV